MNVSASRPTLLPTSVVGSHGLPGTQGAGRLT